MGPLRASPEISATQIKPVTVESTATVKPPEPLTVGLGPVEGLPVSKKGTAGGNPTSAFNMLVRQLSDRPVDKLTPSLDLGGVQRGLDQLEQQTGLAKEVGGQKTGRIGPKFENRTEAQLGGLKYRGRTEGGLSGEGSVQSRAKVGLAGAEAQGQARGKLGGAVQTEHQVDGPLKGSVRGKAGLEAEGNANGQMKLDLQGLRGNADVGGRVGVGGTGGGNFDARVAKGHANVGAVADVVGKGGVRGQVDHRGVGVNASGELGASARVEGDFELRSAGPKVGGEKIDLAVTGRGRAEVAARVKGDAKVDARWDKGPKVGVDVGGEAFVGAKAEGEIKGSLAGIVDVKAHGGAWVGAGAQGQAKLKIDDGKIKVKLAGGAAVKAGAGGGVAVEVDLKKAANVAVGAALQAVTAPVRYSLDPTEVERDLRQLVPTTA